MSFTLTSSGACIAKAGAKMNTIFNGVSGATMLSKWCDDAEGNLCAITRRDWVTLSGSTKTNFAGIIDDTVSDMVAMKIINYDMSGYTSRLEAGTMLDVLRDNISRNMGILMKQENQEVMF